MSHTVTNSILPPQAGYNTLIWLGLFAAAFLAVIFILAYGAGHGGAVELQTAPAQTLLFIDITNQKL